MAGILDKKSRIMDVFITDQGKRQMASGKMKIEYASLSDSQVFYEYDAVSGSSDATDRIYFEATSLPQDFITFEDDDSGTLFDFEISPNIKNKGNMLLRKISTNALASKFNKRQKFKSNSAMIAITGSSFKSMTRGFLTGSIDHFKKLYMIGSRNGIFQDESDFSISPRSIKYSITNSVPFPSGTADNVINIDAIEPVFLDKRFAHFPNFKFLPPVDPKGRKIGNYIPLGEKEILSFNDIIDNIGPLPVEETYDNVNPYSYADGAEKQINILKPGDPPLYPQSYTFKFNNTTDENNIVMQMFEISDNRLYKLDVVDFGEFLVDDDPVRPSKRVFFIGKVYDDSYGATTFVNLFTMVLD